MKTANDNFITYWAKDFSFFIDESRATGQRGIVRAGKAACNGYTPTKEDIKEAYQKAIDRGEGAA